jgi:predicted MPP superfamily phosphohydrolase
MFKKHKLLFRTILFITAIVLAIVVYSGFIEPYRLISSDVVLENKFVPEDSGHITIAFFADTHFSRNYSLKNFEKVLDAVNEKKPDIILFGGDLIDNFNEYTGDMEAIGKSLSQLHAPMGKFAVYGNHDYGGGAHTVYEEIMEKGGFQVLRNESVVFEDIKLILIGLDEFVFGEREPEFADTAQDPGYFNLVLCHEPDIIDMLLDYNIDFMISADTHGGQVNIGQANLSRYRDIFFPPYGRNYIKGIYSFENHYNTALYVNPGIGTAVLPFRFLTPPEITFILIGNCFQPDLYHRLSP